MLSRVHVYGLVLILGILVLFNLPIESARSLKSIVRGLMAPYQSLWSSGRGSRQGNSLPASHEGEAHMAFRLEALERENQALRELLGLKKRIGEASVACRVIARDGASGWWRTVRIDRGSRAGLREGQPVLAAGGVAGLVQEVGLYTAEVLLLSDPAFHVSVRCPRTEALGIVRGGGAEARAGLLEALWPVRPPEFLYADRHLELREGDELVTSGLGGLFPPGLPVGRVRRIGLAPGGLYQEGLVEPWAPLDRLDFVLVLLTAPEEREEAP